MLKLNRGIPARSLQSTGLRARRRGITLGSFALLGIGSGMVISTPGLSEWRNTRPVEPEIQLVEQLPPSDFTVDESTLVGSTLVGEPDSDDPDLRWFNGRPIRPARTMTMTVTAYSPDARSCGKWADGITSSGYSVFTNGMKLVAADLKLLPYGSLVSVPGYDSGQVVPVLDKGGKIKGKRLDVLFPTHEAARKWGSKRLTVTIWEYADGKPVGFRQQHRRS